jgi:hypothetical protein
MSDAAAPQGSGFRFDGTLNLSTILVFAGMSVGGLGVLYTNASDTRLTQSRLEEFRSAVQREANVTQRQIEQAVMRLETALSTLQAQMAPIPDLQARLALVERQLREPELRGRTR